jgi:hypothetical protein
VVCVLPVSGEFHSYVSLSRSARSNALACSRALFAREQLCSEAPARDVIEMEEPGRPAIGKANLEAAALTSQQPMLDDADAVCHGFTP